MKKCQPDFFFPVDEPRRKNQKHLYWMDDITLESTLSSCWDFVSYICVNLWCHCREQTLKPQSSWGFPLLPSSTASAHLHRCKTLPVGFSSRQCLPCDGVDNCTKQPSVSYPRPSSTPMVQPSPNLSAPFLCLNLRNSLPLPEPCGTPSLPCPRGHRWSEGPSMQCPTWKVSLSIPSCFYSGVLRAGNKWASNGPLPCHVSSSLLASITTGIWAARSFTARQKRLGSHPAYVLSWWTAFSHIDHSMHSF